MARQTNNIAVSYLWYIGDDNTLGVPNTDSYIDIVEYLLSLKREGDYWDFKQEWHKDKGELAKDIICFANTPHERDCYIIIGISDDYKVAGIDSSKWSQADILDLLSNLHFAGDLVPEIFIVPITFAGKNVDVLVIKNFASTPIYLKRPYGSMKQGCIYLRKEDKNTPDNGNADINDIELLWKKRLGLVRPPLEYFYERLHNKSEWKSYGDVIYNIYKPEYILNFYDPDDKDSCGVNRVFYSYTMMNEQTSFENVAIKYHDTVLEEYELVILDSGRYKTTEPDYGHIGHGDNRTSRKYQYRYFVKTSNDYILHQFLYDESNHEQRIARDRFFSVILLFDSHQEKIEFEEFLECNDKLIEETLAEFADRYTHIQAPPHQIAAAYIRELHIGLAFKKLHEMYRVH